jgi:hypothetical protein
MAIAAAQYVPREELVKFKTKDIVLGMLIISVELWNLLM